MSRKSFAKDDKSYEAALDRGLTLLEYRARTAREMFRALVQREFPEETAQQAVDRLQELGYINDADYAQRLVRTTLAKGQGARRARYTLSVRGVSEENMQEALGDVSPEDELEAALPRGRKLWERYADQPPRERAGRVSRALAGRGFSYETISQVLRQLGGDLEE